MIVARPGGAFTATLIGAPVGLGGLLGVRIVDPATDATVVARTTQITASDAVPGTYTATLTAPVVTTAEKTFVIVWDDGATPTAATLAVEELVVTVAGSGSVLPDVREVAALLRARTVDEHGNDLGTFTPQTSPTDAEVRQLITHAASDVAARAGVPIPPGHVPEARRLTALLAAALVELSFPTGQDSPMERLQGLYDTGIAGLANALAPRLYLA